MFIHNVNDIKTNKLYKCNKIVYKYLVNNFPLIGFENGKYYFANTKELKECLDNAPMYIKVVLKL